MIQVPAILTRAGTLKDGGLSLSFQTNELSKEQKVVIMDLYQQFGWLLFKPSEYKTEDIPLENAEDKSKTPSKRLRACLFVRWKQAGEKGDFEVYYRDKMELIINQVKATLE